MGNEGIGERGMWGRGMGDGEWGDGGGGEGGGGRKWETERRRSARFYKPQLCSLYNIYF